MSMSRPLVDDVIDDILLRLRVKDLRRFRCLSKSFCAKIDSPAFVAAHLHQSVETKTHRRLCVFLGKDYDGYEGIDLDDEIYSIIELNQPYDHNYRILCSCNGLILFGNGGDGGALMLCNPFTRRMKKVPSATYGFGTYVGLGYDSATNDYKVVTLHPSTARVFHVATNSWSEVAIQTTFQNQKIPFFSISQVAVFANGALHWLSDVVNDYHNVYSFDISRQEFVNILPSTPPRLRGLFLDLHVLGGRLLLGVEDLNSMNIKLYEVDDGDWRNSYTIDLTMLYTRVSRINQMEAMPSMFELTICGPFKVLELSNDGNKILLHYSTARNFLFPNPTHGYLCWYDLQLQTLEHVQILANANANANANVDLIYCHDAFLCWESLDSFDASANNLTVINH